MQHVNHFQRNANFAEQGAAVSWHFEDQRDELFVY
jgi:hypothetical protein